MSESKWYTQKSNCVRAAKKALGKSAAAGTEFTLHQSSEGWGWSPTTKQALATAGEKAAEHAAEPKAKKAKAPKEPKKKREKKALWEQPAMRDVIKLMLRKDGCTVEDIANKRECNKDTARGMVSRLRAEVKGITMGRVFKRVTYFLAAENLPEGWANAQA